MIVQAYAKFAPKKYEMLGDFEMRMKMRVSRVNLFGEAQAVCRESRRSHDATEQ